LPRITCIEGTAKTVVKNEATGQVLGVQFARKGYDYKEYVLNTYNPSDSSALQPSRL